MAKSIDQQARGQGLEGGRPIATRYGLREFLTLLFRERKLLGGVFAVIFVLALIVSFLPSVQYSAESKLLVLLSREYTLRPEVGDTSGTITMEQSQIVKSEMEILNNRALKEATIQKVGFARMYPGLADDAAEGGDTARRAMSSAVEAFSRRLNIEPVRDSTVVHLTFTHRDPQVAAEALNTLVELYLERRREVYSHRGSAFLTSQREDFARRLTDAERKLEAFRQRFGITSFEEQKILLLRQEGELETQRMDAASRLQEATARLQAVETSMAQVPRTTPLYAETSSSGALETAKARLLELELRRNELLTKYAGTSRFVRDVEEQLALVRDFITREGARGPGTRRVGTNPVFESLSGEAIRLRAEVDALRARTGSLDEQIKMMSARRADLDEPEREYRALTLDRDILEQQYQAYAGRSEEARIMEDLDQRQAANVRIIEHAVPPTRGSNRQPMIILLGLFGGVASALAAGFVRDFSRTTVATPESAERALGLPVLGTVGYKEGLAGVQAAPPDRPGEGDRPHMALRRRSAG
ncbi:MAG: GumC family protein [Alphaproteobacteria bacterium]